MMKPLIFVVIVGAALGFMLPTGKPDSPAPPMAQAQPAAAPKRSWPDPKPEETIVERRSNGHFYVTADVNGFPVDFVVDTGATTVALTVDDARRLGIPFDNGEFETVGRTASGEARGKLIDIDVIDIDGKRVPKVSGVIVEGLDVSLLGQSYLSRITAVEMNGHEMRLR